MDIAGRFAALIWTDETDGTPVTIAIAEGAALDVAAYAVQGDHAPAEDWHRITRTGYKLTEKQARAFGAGWPSRLTYRR